MRRRLSPEAVQTALLALPEWHLEAGELTRTMTFTTFPAAIEFVRKVAVLAEEADHHPDIDIRYNKLRFALTTHDAGGLTHHDFALAALLDKALTAI